MSGLRPIRRAALVGLALLASAMALPASAEPAHGIAMHGDPKYPANFSHFDYVNPDAPKGGKIRLSAQGSFDSLNPYIIQGTPAIGTGLTLDTLMVQAEDEAFSLYPLIAESIETPEDRSWVTFRLNPDARFNDGSPITSADVAFTFNILVEKGQPVYRHYWGSVETVETPDERTVTFLFKPGENRELPLILAQMPVMSEAYWAERDFTKSSLDPFLGSGPYRVGDFEAGRYIVYERVEEYWARDLPVNRGRNNFDEIRYEYYRDGTVRFEGFKSGEYDLRQENTAKTWAIRYDFPAARDGRVQREELIHGRSAGMQAWVMNQRRDMFQDRRVRLALIHAYNFDWAGAAYQYGAYRRTNSYFTNSELAATGLPQGEELDILERFRGQIPEEVFTTPYAPPSHATPELSRAHLITSLELFQEAGWELRDAKMTNLETGEVFNFEILLAQPTFEQYALAYKSALERLGVEVSIRTVDIPQYINRLRAFDFDMVVGSWGQSDSPGNEQRVYWGSAGRDQPGSRNWAGISHPVVDELIELLIASPDRDSLVQRVRALDRVLLWGHYVVPQWYNGSDRVAYWDIFGHPEVTPKSGFSVMSWWVDPEKARKLGRGGF